MRVSDVKVGMRLIGQSPVTSIRKPVATVTKITAHGFRYQYDEPVFLGARLGSLRSGEHYGINGEALFDPAPPTPTPLGFWLEGAKWVSIHVVPQLFDQLRI
jgi:hypothetical protein